MADPRTGRRKDHNLVAIITIGIMAILCGAHGFVAWGGLHRLDSFGDPPQTIGSNLLHCAIHPSMVLTKQAIDCLDYQLGESRR